MKSVDKVRMYLNLHGKALADFSKKVLVDGEECLTDGLEEDGKILIVTLDKDDFVWVMVENVATVETKKTWKKEEIVELLEKNDKAVLRGLIVLYSLQTTDEKVMQDTIENNGIGFSGFDAEFLSSLAQQAMKYGRLSERQMEVLRGRIKKYAGQLTKVANNQIIVNV